MSPLWGICFVMKEKALFETGIRKMEPKKPRPPGVLSLTVVTKPEPKQNKRISDTQRVHSPEREEAEQ